MVNRWVVTTIIALAMASPMAWGNVEIAEVHPDTKESLLLVLNTSGSRITLRADFKDGKKITSRTSMGIAVSLKFLSPTLLMVITEQPQDYWGYSYFFEWRSEGYARLNYIGVHGATSTLADEIEWALGALMKSRGVDLEKALKTMLMFFRARSHEPIQAFQQAVNRGQVDVNTDWTDELFIPTRPVAEVETGVESTPKVEEPVEEKKNRPRRRVDPNRIPSWAPWYRNH